MPRIRCGYLDCVFLEDGYCGAAAVEIDPDEGCLTFSRVDDVEVVDEAWEDEELWEDEEDEFFADDEEDEDDDLWLEDD